MKNTYNSKDAQFNKKPKGFYVNDSETKNDKDSGSTQLTEREKNRTKNNPNRPMDSKEYRQKIKDSKANRIPKSKNTEPVSDFISEGNPNTGKVIKETQGENKNQESNRREVDDGGSSSKNIPSALETSIENSSPIDEASGDPTVTQRNEGKEEDDRVGNFNKDEELIQQIKNAIKNEKSIPADEKDISVTIENGAAVLRGTVSSEQIRMNIADQVVSFVGKVSNYLRVMTKDEID